MAPTTPVALISAGVGQTPMLGMLNTLHDNQHQAQVHWLHAAENGSVHAFADEVADIAGRMPNLSHHVWYREPGADDVEGRDYHSRGLMDLSALQPRADPQMHYYSAARWPSCSSWANSCWRWRRAERIHYECFGPHKVL